MHDDFVHLAPHHARDRLLRFEAELRRFVDDMQRGALVVIDMQRDLGAPADWRDRAGLDDRRCREAIPGTPRAV